MNCDACKEREATVHDSTIKAGKIVERHLCEACAAKIGVAPKGVTPPSPAELAAQFIALQKGLVGAQGAGAPGGDKTLTHCRTCNLPFATFRQGGLLGCPDCYVSFEAQLGPMLERYHEGGSRHAGKTPRRAGVKPMPTLPPAPATPAGPSASSSQPRTPMPDRAERTRAQPMPPTPPAPPAPTPAAGAPPAPKAPTPLAPVVPRADEQSKRIAVLRAQLAAAIQAEQYEKAATLRDALRKLGDPGFAPEGKAKPKPDADKGDAGAAGGPA